MAVVQISKIQLRRGKELETGIPQLASGEMAWAVDTQKLYIGNGSVAEGSPGVGNTELLTTNSPLLDLINTYQYKPDLSFLQTSADVNYPILRTLQERLDERINAASFGVVDDVSTDNTEGIQRALDQLYRNESNRTSTGSRVVLEFSPGTYRISSPIYIPSYASIRGSGIGKTVFAYEGTGDCFRVLDDTAVIGEVLPISPAPTFNTQAKNIELRDFTITVNNQTRNGLFLENIRDSVFEDINIVGIWDFDLGHTVNSNSCGIKLVSQSSGTSCQRNYFNRIQINNFSYGVYAEYYSKSNNFDNMEFRLVGQGVTFGIGVTSPNNAPVYNKISKCNFENVWQHGINIQAGFNNLSQGNHFVNVGNDIGGNLSTAYSVIRFNSIGNTSLNDIFDKSNSSVVDNTTLADPTVGNAAVPYIPELEGKGVFNHQSTRSVAVSQTGTDTTLFRLPIPASSVSYEISYVYQSTSQILMRRGKLNIAYDRANNGIQLVDEYEFTGTSGQDENLEFSAVAFNADSVGGRDTLLVKYRNSTLSDVATLQYTYRIIT